mmetsp:Transcript_10986/g.31940  ORF Transcript_10986/g.31940 Transcript_10986/m.31940 type:complete len:224 (-) Transcript_10986:1600-2271(-)
MARASMAASTVSRSRRSSSSARVARNRLAAVRATMAGTLSLTRPTATSAARSAHSHQAWLRANGTPPLPCPRSASMSAARSPCHARAGSAYHQATPTGLSCFRVSRPFRRDAARSPVARSSLSWARASAPTLARSRSASAAGHAPSRRCAPARSNARSALRLCDPPCPRGLRPSAARGCRSSLGPPRLLNYWRTPPSPIRPTLSYCATVWLRSVRWAIATRCD